MLVGRAVLVPWAATRAIVLGALALAHLLVDRVRPTDPAVARTVHQGLLSWDAGYYSAIARAGYTSLGHDALRFFPLYPLTARLVRSALGISAGDGLLVVANLASLAGAALLYVLARREAGAEPARRAVWLLSLAPSAYVLVMGYAEALLLLLAVACFLAVRPRSGSRPAWWWAALWGVAAGLTRPLGIVLCVPVAIEVVRHWTGLRATARLGALAAGVGPVVGGLGYLAWARSTDGDFWLPLRVQFEPGHHGGLSDPLRTIRADAAGVFHHHYGTALHVPWVVVALVLVVVLWRRWPASYAAFATVVVAVGISGTNLDSFERYALSAFPLAMAGATVTRWPAVERVVLVALGAALLGYALLAFLGLSVP
ncbi:MAG TPA: glycosyltransferase family 39 protein [Acidimicrobiales bacterium]